MLTSTSFCQKNFYVMLQCDLCHIKNLVSKNVGLSPCKIVLFQAISIEIMFALSLTFNHHSFETSLLRPV